ncbi:MAG: hypothetical protein U1E65_33665 [Myxococcota bacterium]
MHKKTTLLLATLTMTLGAASAQAAEVYSQSAGGACLAQDAAVIGANGPGLVNLNFDVVHWSCSLVTGPATVPANLIADVTLYVTDRSPTLGVSASLCFRTPGSPEVCGAEVSTSGPAVGNGLVLTVPRPAGRFPVGTIAWLSIFVPHNTSGGAFQVSGVDSWRVNN